MSDLEELRAAQRALAASEAATEKTESVAASARSSREGIRKIITKNGYVGRFRNMIQGNPYASSRP